MTDDPVVDDVHRIRAELLADHGGDLESLLNEAQRRTEQAARAGREVVIRQPRPPRAEPAPTNRSVIGSVGVANQMTIKRRGRGERVVTKETGP